MTTISGNGSITFGDSTVKSTASFAWTQLTNRPTALSQFTNNLGNYGGWLTTSNFTLGNVLSNPNNIFTNNNCSSHVGKLGQRTTTDYNLTWNGSTVGLQITNCNCNCNC